MNLSALKRKKESIKQEGYISDCWIASYRPKGTAKGENRYYRLESRVPFENGKRTRHLKPEELHTFRQLVANGQLLKKIERDIALLQGKKASSRDVLTSSASDEWYTPPEYIEMAREIMGGIDIDPATSQTAQAWVRASTWYTIKDDGLARPWQGRLWLNPPYGAQIGQWTQKAAAAHDSGRVSAGMLLVRPAPGSAWYQELAGRYASCILHRRIRFIDANGKAQASPVHGNVFFYMGQEIDRFREVFSTIGVVTRPF